MMGKKGRVTDLKGVHRSIRKTSSILSSAIAEAPRTKTWYTPQLRRPSTVPPPRRPMQALKKLQFAITEDLDAYKRMSPRERGPGMYDLRLDGAMVVKEPNKPSFCFAANSGRAPIELQSPSSTISGLVLPRSKFLVKPHQNGANDDNNMKTSNAKVRSSKGIEDINQLSFQKSFASLMQTAMALKKSYAERQKK